MKQLKERFCTLLSLETYSWSICKNTHNTSLEKSDRNYSINEWKKDTNHSIYKVNFPLNTLIELKKKLSIYLSIYLSSPICARADPADVWC